MLAYRERLRKKLSWVVCGPDQEIASVTAEGAYDTRKCHDAIAKRCAAAIIPLRRNAKPWKAATAAAVARNEALRASKHLGRALWRPWSRYHRRSRAETKMQCVKRLGLNSPDIAVARRSRLLTFLLGALVRKSVKIRSCAERC